LRKRYDRTDTLFYLDPPYWGCEDDYGKALFVRDDFDRLEGVLKGIQGRFILSLNDVQEVRELFSAYHIEAVRTRYSINGGKQKQVGEVLISN
jgi:DNA adenine methylase